MSTKTRRRANSPAVWAALVVLGIPAVAGAQTQLFPLAPIQRQRVPCPMEDPVYGLYRQQYFGYFPTCWRVFPPGWGCPSSEAPNAARAFQERKRDPLPEELPPMEETPGPETPPGTMRGRAPAAPPLPPTRSPFEIDTPPGTIPPADRTPPPGPAAGLPSRSPRSGLSALPPAARRIEPPQAAPDEKREGIDGPAPLLALPDVVEPPGPSIPGALPAPAELPSTSTGPLPTLPDAGIGGARPAVSSGPVAAPVINIPIDGVPSQPVQAPQRRGPISSLFNGMSSWIRR
jgi:hypothetical protein